MVHLRKEFKGQKEPLVHMLNHSYGKNHGVAFLQRTMLSGGRIAVIARLMMPALRGIFIRVTNALHRRDRGQDKIRRRNDDA
jgi:hypothetical protein